MANKHFNTFIEYIKDAYYNTIHEAISIYIAKNRCKLNISSRLVPSPTHIELNDFHLGGPSIYGTGYYSISVCVPVRTEIEISDFDTHKCEDVSDIITPWLSVTFTAVLHNGLHGFYITEIRDYDSSRKSNTHDALTTNLIPYISSDDLDIYAERFLKKYCPLALQEPIALPVEGIAAEMGLKIRYAPLADGVFGQTYFNQAEGDIYKSLAERTIIHTQIEPGTILVNPDVFFIRNIGSINNTVIHECVHWFLHYRFFELQKLLNPEVSSLSCAEVKEITKRSDNLSKELDWMEWQANTIAPRILIPARTGREKLSYLLELINAGPRSLSDAQVMEQAIREFAQHFCVSKIAAKIRAIELGFDQAAGVFNRVEGRECPAFSFAKGSLQKGQTYMVDTRTVICQFMLNNKIVEDSDAGLFIHAGGVLVINDSKYVTIKEGAEASLTEYALTHINECCLVFHASHRNNDNDDSAFYGMCFLSREVDSSGFIEAEYDPNEGENDDVIKNARELAKVRDEIASLQSILRKCPSSFGDALTFHMKRKQCTNELLEERSHISARTIQDYRNDPNIKPTLPSVMALCIGLNLQSILAESLIGKAGYSLTQINDENLAYKYLIQHHSMEGIDSWNAKLESLGVKQRLPRNYKTDIAI